MSRFDMLVEAVVKTLLIFVIGMAVSCIVWIASMLIPWSIGILLIGAFLFFVWYFYRNG